MKRFFRRIGLALALAVFAACFTFAGVSAYAAEPALSFAGDAPQFKLTYGAITEDVTVPFAYGGSGTLTLTRSYAPEKGNYSSHDADYPLAQGTDYTVSGDTLTIKKEYLSGLEQGTFWYKLTDGASFVEFPVFIGYSGGWAVRSARGEITPSAYGDNYADISLNGYHNDREGGSMNGEYERTGRAVYTAPLDVTKPIFIEYTGYDAGGWILFNFNSDPFASEYANEIVMTDDPATSGTPGVIKILDMVDNGGEPQRFGGSAGFITNNVVNVGSYKNRNNSNVVEIYVGETAEQSYIRYNGNDLTAGFASTGAVELVRSSFPEGQAWLSILCGTPTDFTVNKTLNAPAVYYPEGEPEYTLKTDDDVRFRVHNVDGGFDIYNGDERLEKDVDYSVQGERVTVFGSYMKTVSFISTVKFTVVGGGKSTVVKIPASVPDGTSGATLAQGENGVRVFEGGDMTFNVDFKGETFVNVIDAETYAPLDAALVSVQGSALTLSAAAVSGRPHGTYRFLIQTEGSLVPVYVIHYGFANGYAASGVEVTRSGGKYTVSGTGSLVFADFVDLGAGVNFGLKITSTPGYYNSGFGDRDAYVELAFADITGRKTVTVRIRPNAEDSDPRVRNKLYAEVELSDGDGNVVRQNSAPLRLNLADEQTLAISVSGGTLSVTVGSEPSVQINVGDFNAEKLLLSVNTAEDMGYTLATSPAPDAPSTGDTSTEEKGGCSGGMAAQTAVLAAICGVSAILLKRKK